MSPTHVDNHWWTPTKAHTTQGAGKLNRGPWLGEDAPHLPHKRQFPRREDDVARWTSSQKCRGEEAGNPCLHGTGSTRTSPSLVSVASSLLAPHPCPCCVLWAAARLVPVGTGSRCGYRNLARLPSLCLEIPCPSCGYYLRMMILCRWNITSPLISTYVYA